MSAWSTQRGHTRAARLVGPAEARHGTHAVTEHQPAGRARACVASEDAGGPPGALSDPEHSTGRLAGSGAAVGPHRGAPRRPSRAATAPAASARPRWAGPTCTARLATRTAMSACAAGSHPPVQTEQPHAHTYTECWAARIQHACAARCSARSLIRQQACAGRVALRGTAGCGAAGGEQPAARACRPTTLMPAALSCLYQGARRRMGVGYREGKV